MTPDNRPFENVPWLGRTAANDDLRDAPADIALANSDRVFLAIEVKSGEISRDALHEGGPRLSSIRSRRRR